MYFRFNTKTAIDLNGFTLKSNDAENYIHFTAESENSELTIKDSSADVLGKLSISSISCDAGRLNINSGTFKCNSIGSILREGGITSITGGRFIIDPDDSLFFSHDALDSYTPLGYESVKVDTTDYEC